MQLCAVVRAVNYVLLLVQPKCQGEMSFIQVDLYAQDRLCLEPLQSVSEILWYRKRIFFNLLLMNNVTNIFHCFIRH